MKNVGITGGIGSGKSLVGRIFVSLGYRLYEADSRAKILMIENPRIVEGVKGLFGAEAYLDDGTLNRAYIGKIVFNDQHKLQQLNAIVHPETGRDYLEWVAATPKDYDKSFVLKEAAILYESGAHKSTDAVLSIYAPQSLRIQRVADRDQTDTSAVKARMDKQWAEWEKYRRADFTIINDGIHLLLPQVKAAIQ
ncbi:MAG: dephospho-CoA kinase, partial [Bacteroidota bacterium]